MAAMYLLAAAKEETRAVEKEVAADVAETVQVEV